ncbi:RHS repeat-associated core domain-containing protein, partial [Flavobacteriaceae bacterium]|nr:RHS repeat-associated core domain-containing protein [Flavobacteriaceae bacterium]
MYPFGLKHKGYNNTISSNGNSVAQRWKFGGKEYSEELGINTYDFGARNYNPDLGRWSNIDPLADVEKQLHASPYAYANNNPIYYIDPDGRIWIPNGEGGWIAEEGDTVSGLEQMLDLERGDISIVNGEGFDEDNIQIGQVVTGARRNNGRLIVDDSVSDNGGDPGSTDQSEAYLRLVHTKTSRALVGMFQLLLAIERPSPYLKPSPRTKNTPKKVKTSTTQEAPKSKEKPKKRRKGPPKPKAKPKKNPDPNANAKRKKKLNEIKKRAKE